MKMFIHPSTILFMMTILTSIIMITTSDNLLLKWLSLEINMMSFLPLMLHKNKYSSEATIKFFLIQTISSVMIMLMIMSKNNMYMALMMMALMLKTGAAPFHQWAASLSEGISWNTMFMLMTLQKLPPMFFLLMMKTWPLYYYLLILSTTFSTIIPPMTALPHNSLRKMMIYSSISNIAWMLVSLFINQHMLLIFLSFYTLINLALINFFSTNQMFYLNQLYTKKKNSNILAIINMLSLAGMPPFTGFLPKLWIIKEMLLINMLLLITLLMTMTIITLYLYLRITITFILLNPSTKKKKKKKSMIILLFNIMLNMLPPLMIL